VTDRVLTNERARVGWTSGGYTGEGIPTFASSSIADRVNSMHDHINLANIMPKTAGIESPNN